MTVESIEKCPHCGHETLFSETSLSNSMEFCFMCGYIDSPEEKSPIDLCQGAARFFLSAIDKENYYNVSVWDENLEEIVAQYDEWLADDILIKEESYITHKDKNGKFIFVRGDKDCLPYDMGDNINEEIPE